MRGLIGKEECIVTKQNKSIKQFVLIVLSFLMVFGNVAVADATVNYDNEVAPLYVNILSHRESIEISGIKAKCTAKLKSQNSVPLKIKMELQKEKSKSYETVETWTSSKTGTLLAMSESRNINVLCNYRLKVTFTAGKETEVVYKYWWPFNILLEDIVLGKALFKFVMKEVLEMI